MNYGIEIFCARSHEREPIGMFKCEDFTPGNTGAMWELWSYGNGAKRQDLIDDDYYPKSPYKHPVYSQTHRRRVRYKFRCPECGNPLERREGPVFAVMNMLAGQGFTEISVSELRTACKLAAKSSNM